LHLVRELRGTCSNRSAVAWGAPLIRWSDDGAIVLAARPIASFLGIGDRRDGPFGRRRDLREPSPPLGRALGAGSRGRRRRQRVQPEQLRHRRCAGAPDNNPTQCKIDANCIRFGWRSPCSAARPSGARAPQHALRAPIELERG
jgi:hypothetical protein